MNRISGLVFALILTVSHGFEHFQNKIPNGRKVPHPIKPNFIWWGVGHKNRQGGGDRNQFGIDFQQNGQKWDKTLCEKDSDGDGLKNGDELGDTSCTWSEGNDDPPPPARGLSHPGICEPITTDACKARNDFKLDKELEYNCPPTKQADARNFKITLAETAVPAKETTYMCQGYDIPDANSDYHIIGSEIINNNRRVLHHVEVYACDAGAKATVDSFRSPRECSMEATVQCPNLVGGWTLGEMGQCLGTEYGYRIGKTGFKYLIMQAHWNNPQKASDQRDSSGMIMYYTSRMRPSDGGVLTIGQRYLQIPPGILSHQESGGCSAACTSRKLKGGAKINLVGVQLHMHYLGRGGTVTLTKANGEKKILADEKSFRYDSPKDYETNVQLEAGDDLDLQCRYNSQGKSKTIYYGDGTQEEMCFAFFGYYPAVKGFSTCYNFRSVDECALEDESFQMQGCNPYTYYYTDHFSNMFTSILTACANQGQGQCTAQCRAAWTEIHDHSCWKGDFSAYNDANLPEIEKTTGAQIQGYLRSCGFGRAAIASSASHISTASFVAAILSSLALYNAM